MFRRYSRPLAFIIILFFASLNHLCFAQDDIEFIISSQISVSDSLRKSHKRYEQALRILDGLLRHKEFKNSSEESKSIVYHKIGVNYLLKRNYELAIIYFDSTLTIRERNSYKNRSEKANSYYLRGRAKQGSQFHQAASMDFLKAVEIQELISDSRELVRDKQKLFQYYSFAAKSFRDMEDFGQATKYYLASESIVNEAYGENSRRAAGFYSSLGLHYYYIKDYFNAEKFSQKALSIYYKLGVNDFWLQILTVKLNLANQYIDNEKFELAIQSYVDLLNDIDKKKIVVGEIDVFNAKRKCFANLGLAQLKLGQYLDAKSSYENVLSLLNENISLQSTVYTARAYEGLADVAAAQNNFPESLDL